MAPLFVRVSASTLVLSLAGCQSGSPASHLAALPLAPTSARATAPEGPTPAPPPVPPPSEEPEPATVALAAVPRKRNPRSFRVAHVFVALCDNKHQGIVPVPSVVGNGQDPEHNLYWGASFGVKTFFQRSPNWDEVTRVEVPRNPGVLRRAVFKSRKTDPSVIVIADAFDGAFMANALATFLDAATGANENDVDVDGEKVQAGGLADLVAFVGHNGLMDMDLATVAPKGTWSASGDQPDFAVVLACLSHRYFAAPLASAACRPLITTSSLMAPEAYSLDAILRSWAAGDSPKVTRNKAGDAYARYQRIAVGAGRGVFVAGP